MAAATMQPTATPAAIGSAGMLGIVNAEAMP
jgi:hypothetical protein